MGSCLSSEIPGGLPPSAPGRRKDRRKLRRTSSSSSSSPYAAAVDSKLELWLRKIPGRVCSNGSSETASLFTKQGRKGTNQDSMIVWENFGSKADTTFCGVFDGHGPYGHLVSKNVRDSLPIKLSSLWELVCKSRKEVVRDSNDAFVSSRSQDSSDDEFFSTLKDSFIRAFKVMDKELKLHPHIDAYCSGSTAVTLIKQGQDLVIGNIGDSRAVMGTRDDDNRCVAVQLTVDLKPSVPRELERIKICKGRVFSLYGEPDVQRVWLPHCDSPGLAMSRAFGDFCLKNYGVISIPDVSHHRIGERDEFVVLATDGIWDVLANDDVVSIVASAPRSTAARVLVEAAVDVWRYRFASSKVDDCAAVCLFFNSSAPGSILTSAADQKTMAQETTSVEGNINQSPVKVELGFLDDSGSSGD